MVNLRVESHLYVVNEDYRAGALACRKGWPSHNNPSPISTRAHRDWQQGFQNETKYLHVVEGVDILGQTGSITFAQALSSGPEARPRAKKLAYASALMTATGLYEDGAVALAEDPYITPHRLRQKLERQGHSLTTELADQLLHRLRLDTDQAGEELTATEIANLRHLKETRQRMLLALADLQETYYDAMVPNTVLATRCGKSSAWPNAVARTLKQHGLGFLARFTGKRCTLTAKGWTVVRALRMRNPAAEEALAPAASQLSQPSQPS